MVQNILLMISGSSSFFKHAICEHHSDVIMGAMASQINSLTVVITEPFIQAQIKENIKAPRHWPLWGEFTDNRKMFPFDDVIMKSYGLLIAHIWVCHDSGEFKMIAHMKIKTLYRASSNPAINWNLGNNISYLCKTKEEAKGKRLISAKNTRYNSSNVPLWRTKQCIIKYMYIWRLIEICNEINVCDCA